MKKIIEIRKRRVEHFAKIRAKRAQKIKDQYDKNEVQKDIALIRSPASKLTLKQLVEQAKNKKAKVKIITNDQDIELDADSDEQYNYSEESEMEMEAEVN